MSSRDRLALAQAAVEADREATSGGITDCAAHANDAVDMREQRVGLHVAVAGGEDHEPNGAPGRAEGLLDRRRRYELRAAIGALKVQAVLALVGVAAVAAEVDHRRLELA